MHWYNNNSTTPRDHNNGMCLTIRNTNNVIGSQLEQNTCKSSSYQQFEVTDDEKVRISVNDPHPGEGIDGFDGHLKMQKYKGYWNDKLDFFKTLVVFLSFFSNFSTKFSNQPKVGTWID